MESGSTEIKSKEIQFVKTSELIPYDKNMNKHTPEQIDRLCKLIEYQGFRDPLIVQRGTNRIACGHGRWECAKKLGMEEVPVIYQEFESEEQFYSFVVSHNAIAEWSALDLSQINLDIQDLGPELDIEMLGLKDFEVEPLDKLDPKTDEDAVPEVEHPITRRGDVWLLGNHRVMCGDSTMIDDVEKLMNGEKADMVFTDPPYGINAVASSGVLSANYEQYANEEDDSCALDFLNMCIGKDWDIICFGGNYFAHALPKSTHWIVWDKRGSDMEGGNANGDQSDCEIAWTNLKKKNVKTYKHVWAGWFRAGNKKEELKTKVHPSQKPVGLFVNIFNDYKFQSIFDGFLGSGSTLIACEKTNRKCYGMELDEKYCDVIIKRWEEYTGKTATLEATGQTYSELKVERDG